MINELIQKIGTGPYKDGSSLYPGVTYHPIPFPEYSHIPCHKKSCIREWEVIKSHYDFKNKTVLEIGSNVGYFSFNMEREGAEVVGFEADESVYNVAEAIRNDKKLGNILFINRKFDKPWGMFKPDVCLMLNCHQWMVKQNGFEGTKEILKSLSGCNLFFQTAHAESSAMYKVDELKDLDGILDYLRECGFKSPELIYTSNHDNHPRYLIKA